MVSSINWSSEPPHTMRRRKSFASFGTSNASPTTINDTTFLFIATSSAHVARRQTSETTLASAELLDRARQLGGVEVGPQHAREDELGVGALPQQEVGHALLAAAADEEVD